MSLASVERHERVANYLPTDPAPGTPWWKAFLRDPWTWLTVAMTLLYAGCLLYMYAEVSADRPVEGGVIPGLNYSALRDSLWLAFPTLAFWTLAFLAVDRFRPMRWRIWWLTLGWGAAVATLLSMYANTWAAEHMAVSGDGDPAASARSAIYAAPFVEEAAKATVLFLIALLIRYRLVSKLSGIVLAGLSAAGFAFTENIIYYARVIVYASSQIGAGDAAQALHEIVMLRGLILCFGHPLFTAMTGVGLAVALRTHSKVVRVLAPLAGYLAAALLHMLFNSQVTLNQGLNEFLNMLLTLGWGAMLFPLLVIAGPAGFLLRQIQLQGRLIDARLTDYVRMGWLEQTDPLVFSKVRFRLRAILLALTRGWRPLVATVNVQRAVSELAYLRDAEVKGTIDEAARLRGYDLLERIRSLRGTAITDPRGLRYELPRLRLPKRTQAPPPSYPGPAGLAGSWPAPPGSAPLGSTTYSPVNPTWGPPPA